MKRVFLLAVAILLLVAGTSVAQGPRITRGRYQPSRPVISPYLYLSQPSVGGVPSYYAWVRPQFEAERRNAEVDRRFQAVDRQLTREQTATGSGPPSRSSTFMNYSHFYSSPGGNSSGGGSR